MADDTYYPQGPASKDLEHAVNADPGDKKAYVVMFAACLGIASICTEAIREFRKAVAELQMVRRMLAEQAKATISIQYTVFCFDVSCLLNQDARAHAKCVMSDSTRSAAMPTRKLTP